MAINYITLKQALDIHKKTIELSGGGTLKIINSGRLESVLEHIKNDDYYPSFSSKLTHLFFSACKFHCFADGNKRIAITLCTQMLLLNGYLYCSKIFLHEMENISYHVAAGKISKDLLQEIVEAVLEERLDEESIKLKILRAIGF